MVNLDHLRIDALLVEQGIPGRSTAKHLREAADEIEKLRAALEDLRQHTVSHETFTPLMKGDPMP